MSAIAAIIRWEAPPAGEAPVLQMLDAMRSRGGEVRQVVRIPPAALGVARFQWEAGPDFSGPVRVLEEGDVAVAADASLYHQEELRRTLRREGVEPGPTPSHLILAAYRRFGDACARLLEGDFVFVLYDRARNRVLAARDFLGTRPLHYALVDGALIAASTIAAVRSQLGGADDLNLQVLAETSSLLLAPSHETAYRAIRSLPAGHLLRFEGASRKLVVERFWSAPPFVGEAKPKVGFEEATLELRHLLEEAVAERMPRSGRISVSLSGGWDSPILFGLAHRTARRIGVDPSSISPVSISFPPGDSGREDELIAEITAHYSQCSHWLDITDIPLLYEDLFREAAERDDPLVHPFLPTNRALAAAAAVAGARVAFNGYGGDTLFHGEISYLGDLLARGNVREFRREWSREGLSGFTTLYRHILLPRLGRRSRRLLARLTRRPVMPGHLDKPVAPWIRKEFAVPAASRERSAAPARAPHESLESFEHRWMLEHPLYPRMLAWIASISLAQGVEERMPLIDPRLVRFAASRPRSERRSEGTTKRLLRAAAADLLPPRVLAPRPARTGTMADYFAQSMARDLPRLSREIFRDPVLAQLGIVDPDRLRRAVGTLRPDRSRIFDAAIYTTFQTEAWLRANA